MSSSKRPDLFPLGDYNAWVESLKTRVRQTQARAALAVNKELVLLYWTIGSEILERQQLQGLGTKVVERLAKDLVTSFPSMTGMSARNLKYMRAFAAAWPAREFVQ